MKLLLVVVLIILALNALVILAVAGILVKDHLRLRKERKREEQEDV